MYVTPQELADHLDLEIDAAVNAHVQMVIEACQDHVEVRAGNGVRERRVFKHDDAETTREFDYFGQGIIEIDDVRDISSVTIDGEEISEFVAYPRNRQPTEYLAIDHFPLQNSRSKFIPKGVAQVLAVTGKFSYSTTPPPRIKIAVMTLAGKVIEANSRTSQTKHVTDQKLADNSVTYQSVEKAAAAFDIEAMLHGYKRETIKETALVQKI